MFLKFVVLVLNLDFNTKFVIAKFNRVLNGFYHTGFQYKICYSKISLVPLLAKSFDIFQYKICYSKIWELSRTFLYFIYFNTKFVIAKLQNFLLKSLKSQDFNTKFVIAKSHNQYFYYRNHLISIQNLL